MCAARKFHHRNISAEQSVDVGQMLANGDFVSHAFIVFVPLVVIVKDHCDDLVEAVDETIGAAPS